MRTLRKRIIHILLACIVLIGLSMLIQQNAQAAESKFVVKKGVLVKYNGSDKKITIPKNVKEIGFDAFSDCNNLQTVIIPGNVKKIGQDAFSGCFNLKKVVMKNGVTAIGMSAFACDKLNSITIPKSVKTIKGYAFYETPWLIKKSKQRKDRLVIVNHILIDGSRAKGKVKIPKGVTAIADSAFAWNEKISGVAIPSTVKAVGLGAFAHTKIKMITFPKSVKSIGEQALYACNKLKEVTILNHKAKIMWDNSYTGGTIFDGKPFAGHGNYTIVMKGYKNSTAAKLSKYMNSLDDKSDFKRYKKIKFKTLK